MALDFKNNEDITFSPINATYKEGKELSPRYVSLSLANGEPAPPISPSWGKRILARDRFSQNIVTFNRLTNPNQTVVQNITSLTRIRHTHLENITDIIISDDETAFITDLQKNLNLETDRSQITKRRDGLYEIAQIAEWLKQLCVTLKYCHEKNSLLHGDISPKNLYITTEKIPEGTLILSSIYQTRISDQERTAAFQSPQVGAGRPYTLADEIYSFGATAYYLITQLAPAAVDPANKVSINIPETISDLGAQNYIIPRHWNNVISQCLNIHAKARPYSIEQIEKLLFGSHSPATPSTPQIDASVITAETKEQQQRIEKNEAQIETLKKELESSLHSTNQLETDIAQTEKTLQRVKTELVDAQENLKAASSHSDNKDIQRIQELQNRINDLKEEIEVVSSEKNQLSRESILIRSEAEDLRSKQNDHTNQLKIRQSSLDEARTENNNLTQEVENLKQGVKPISTPILIALLAAILIGGTLSLLTGGKETKTAHYNQIHAQAQNFLPNSIGDTSEPVSYALFYQYLTESNLTDEDIAALVPTLTSENHHSAEPVTNVPYWLAERFCSWLTQFAQNDTDIISNYYARLPHYEEAQEANKGKPTTFPEWTATQKSNSEKKQKHVLGQLLYSSKGNKETYWQAHNIGISSQGEPIGFRVVFDQLK